MLEDSHLPSQFKYHSAMLSFFFLELLRVISLDSFKPIHEGKVRGRLDEFPEKMLVNICCCLAAYWVKPQLFTLSPSPSATGERIRRTTTKRKTTQGLR